MKELHSTDAAIIELIDYFTPLCNDAETMHQIRDMASDWHKWSKGHEIFDRVRAKTLIAERASDSLKTHQYLFEEICAKTLYNLSNPQDPFDSDSAFWVLPIALQFADVLKKEPLHVSSLLKKYI